MVDMKPKHEVKNCQRCGDGFECKTGSILLCQCQTVVLTQEQREYIAAHYDDCLCSSCLDILRREFNALRNEKNIKPFDVRKV